MTFGALAAVAASSSHGDDAVPGVLGFLVVAAMGVALVFLLRSMNKQFRKITPEEPADPQPPGEDAKTPAQTPRLPRGRREDRGLPAVQDDPESAWRPSCS